jgi:hypothetical protein
MADPTIGHYLASPTVELVTRPGASIMTALRLGLSLLDSRKSAWLTAKQSDPLRDRIAQDIRQPSWPCNRPFECVGSDGNGWALERAAPNGCSILRRVEPKSADAMKERDRKDAISKRYIPLLEAAALAQDIAEYIRLSKEYSKEINS